MTDWNEHLQDTAKHLAGLYSVRGTRAYGLHRLHTLMTSGQYEGLLESLPEDMREEYLRLRAKKEASA